MVSVGDKRGADVAHLHPATIGEMRCGKCRAVMATIYATDEGRKAEIARMVSYERVDYKTNIRYGWHVVDVSLPGTVGNEELPADGRTQLYCPGCRFEQWVVWSDALAESLRRWSTKRRAYVVG